MNLELNKKLPKRWVHTIYSTLSGKYSKIYIQKVVYGERNNNEIMKEAVKLAEEKAQADKELLEKINKLI